MNKQKDTYLANGIILLDDVKISTLYGIFSRDSHSNIEGYLNYESEINNRRNIRGLLFDEERFCFPNPSKQVLFFRKEYDGMFLLTKNKDSESFEGEYRGEKDFTKFTHPLEKFDGQAFFSNQFYNIIKNEEEKLSVILNISQI